MSSHFSRCKGIVEDGTEPNNDDLSATARVDCDASSGTHVLGGETLAPVEAIATEMVTRICGSGDGRGYALESLALGEGLMPEEHHSPRESSVHPTASVRPGLTKSAQSQGARKENRVPGGECTVPLTMGYDLPEPGLTSSNVKGCHGRNPSPNQGAWESSVVVPSDQTDDDMAALNRDRTGVRRQPSSGTTPELHITNMRASGGHQDNVMGRDFGALDSPSQVAKYTCHPVVNVSEAGSVLAYCGTVGPESHLWPPNSSLWAETGARPRLDQSFASDDDVRPPGPVPLGCLRGARAAASGSREGELCFLLYQRTTHLSLRVFPP